MKVLLTKLKVQQTKPKTTILSQETQQVIKVIETFFESGKTKNLAQLRQVQLDGPDFSCFSDLPPHDLKNYTTTIALEELKFASISDYDYQIRNPKISLFGDTAVAAFELSQKGMIVDNKAYTGEHISITGRATFVLVKKSSVWKIVHIHLSRIKE